MDPEDLFSARRVARAEQSGYTRSQLRAQRWTRPTRGVVRLAGVIDDPVIERLSTAIALATEHCVLGGWAALRLQGNSWFDGWAPAGIRPVLIHCEAGSRLRPRDAITPFRGLLHPDEWSTVDGLPVTTLARAAFDEMRLAASVREAVVVADMATSTVTDAARSTLDNIGRTISVHHKVRGIVQATAALQLASSRSASPWETRTRLLAQLDAGLTRLRVNTPVFGTDGTLLGVADLLDEDSGLVIESDGAHHREASQHAEDNRREEAFERAGLVVVRVTALDHGDRPQTARRIRSAHHDASAVTRSSWTTHPPDWRLAWPQSRAWR